MNIWLFVIMVCNSVQAWSLNQTLTEKGVALQYSSHIDGYDPDIKDSGVPVIYGLLQLKNPMEFENVTVETITDEETGETTTEYELIPL